MNGNIIQILKINKIILHVIIFGRIIYKFQNNGKINNIKIHKKLKKEKILQKQCIKLIMRRRYQIKNIIIILLL